MLTDAGISTMSYPVVIYPNGVEVRIRMVMNYENGNNRVCARETTYMLAEQISRHIHKFKYEPEVYNGDNS